MRSTTPPPACAPTGPGVFGNVGVAAAPAALLAGSILAALVGLASVACVRPELEGRRCADDADCVDGYRCVAEVCLADGQNPPASTLLNDDCPRLLGDDTGGPVDAAVVADATQVALVGVLLPLSKGGVLFENGVAREEAVALGLTAVNVGGGVFGRRIVGVSCNSDGDVETARRAAAHLAAVGVPIVIGEQASSTTLAVFSDELRDAGVMMIAPSATSVDLTSFPDSGLLARTTVSDARQGPALGTLLATDFDRVAVLAVDDSYGTSLLEGVRQVLCAGALCSTAGAFTEARFPPDLDAPTLDDLVGRVAAARPDAVAILGQAAQARPLLERLGGLLPAAALVLSDAARTDAVFTTPTPLPAEVVARVIGTAPKQRVEGVAFEQLRASLSAGARDASFVAHAYDAAVVAGLLHAAAGDVLHPRGAALAPLLSRLVAPEPVLFTIGLASGGRDVTAALRALQAGGVINLEGTSGPLDFDVNGDVSGDIELWRRCPSPAGDVLVTLGTAVGADGAQRAVERSCSCALAEVGCAPGDVCDADSGGCLAACDGPVGAQCVRADAAPGTCAAVGDGFGCL